MVSRHLNRGQPSVNTYGRRVRLGKDLIYPILSASSSAHRAHSDVILVNPPDQSGWSSVRRTIGVVGHLVEPDPGLLRLGARRHSSPVPSIAGEGVVQARTLVPFSRCAVGLASTRDASLFELEFKAGNFCIFDAAVLKAVVLI